MHQVRVKVTVMYTGYETITVEDGENEEDKIYDELYETMNILPANLSCDYSWDDYKYEII